MCSVDSTYGTAGTVSASGEYGRRRVLALLSAASVGVAGCLGGIAGGGGDGDENGDGGSSGEWDETYGDDAYETYLYGVEPTGDGGYLATGSEGTAEASQDGLILKTDEAGHVEWSKRFGGSGWDWLDTAIETASGYVAGGTRLATESSGADAWVLAVDEDGRRLWEETYRDERFTFGWSMVGGPNGGYLVVGRTAVERNGPWRPWVLKVDAGGSEQWRTASLPDGTSSARYNDAAPRGDGYLVSGTVRPEDGDSERGYAVGIDQDGTEAWDRTYDVGRFGHLSADGDGYVVSGDTGDTDTSRGWLLRMDGEGGQQWSRRYDRDDAAGLNDVVSLGNGPFGGGGGGYLAVGWSRVGSGDETVWLLEVDREGNPEASTGWDDYRWSNVWAVEPSADGAYVVAGFGDEDGTTADEHRSQGRLVKTSGVGGTGG